MATTVKALEIENLKYKNILNNISFSLNEKSFNILIGSNSSGKTTLIKCIAGLLEFEGNITIFNEMVTKGNHKNLMKKIGIYMGHDYLVDGTTLYNITYVLNNLGYSNTESKKIAYDISKKLDIEYLLTKDVNELSLYEKKLVSFAASIVHKPKLLIIDDSFDELDSYYRKKIIDYLKGLKKCTVLFVTNNEKDYIIADNLIFINGGRVIKTDCLGGLLNEEKLFFKNNTKLPFLADLANKLKSYELIEDVILDIDEMVNLIWK